MNEELLDTPIVKSAIKRYLSEGKTLEEIREKLRDIHLIIITKEELLKYIKELSF